MESFRNLKVWEKAHAMTLDVYRSTSAFPKEELYGLTSQMRRCSASVGANIAEGCYRNGDKDFGRFIQIAAGSAGELEYHILLARNLGLLNADDYQRLSTETIEVKRMLTSLLQRLRADS